MNSYLKITLFSLTALTSQRAVAQVASKEQAARERAKLIRLLKLITSKYYKA